MESHDIFYHYKKMNEAIEEVEKDNTNKEQLMLVEQHFKKVLEDIEIILIMKKERYYGPLLMNFNLKIDFCYNYPAAVSIECLPFDMTFNPLLIGKYTIKEMIYIVAHELEHIVLDHPTEAVKINTRCSEAKHIKLNYAMDASVNDRLDFEIEKYDLEIMSTPDNLITSKTISELSETRAKKLQDFKYYYELLPEPKVVRMLSGKADYVVTVNNREAGEVLHEWTSSDNPEHVHELVKEYVEKSLEALSSEERDKFPEYQKSALEKLMAKPKISWDHLLKRYVGTVPSSHRKTRTRLSRRQPERYDVSGIAENRTVNVVVAIDTSASMSNELINKCLMEVLGILKHVKHEVTVIECDCKIQKIYKINRASDIQTTVFGRGGTAFSPVIEYINNSRKYRDSILVYFTDGFGESYIPKPQVRHMMWVVTNNNESVSAVNPYGRILTIN